MKMYLLFIALMASGLLAGASTATNTSGFLVFEVEHYAYAEGRHGGSDRKQQFKVPLTEEFLANFKRLPATNSSGTGFLCRGGHSQTSTNDASNSWFIWWLERTADSRWHIHMWGQGFETIKGVPLHSGNVTQSMTIKNLEDLDMSYQQSYVNKYDGVNVQFSAKYVPAKDIDAGGHIPNAPVQKADRTVLFPGDDLKDSSIQLTCLFQEN